MSNEIEETVAVADEGALALRQALAAEGLEYALTRCLEEYALALDGAGLVAEVAGVGAADRRAYLSYVESTTRAGLLADARERRDRAVYLANRALGEWRRVYGARQRSMPQSFHEFVES
jgi:hypothetical protein